METNEELIKEARAFASASPLGKPLARELDKAIGTIQRLADALEAATPKPQPSLGCESCYECIAPIVEARPWPDNLMFPFIVCAECGNKRCAKAETHTNECTGSNEPGQVGSTRYPAPPWQPLPVEGESSDEA